MIAYLIYTVGITAFIYPVAVHWVWHEEGWLCAWNKSAIFGLGMIDFAGSGLVHMMGGLAGMVGSIVCGPRQGAFDKPKAPKFQGHSAVLVSLGTWCLWFGWFGFSAGYTMKMTGGMSLAAAKIVVNTALAPAVSALVVAAIQAWRCSGQLQLNSINAAVLAGLVGITGPCGVVTPTSALIVGAVSGLVYLGSVEALWKLQVDDPIGAVSIHAFPGMWGILASGLFATQEGIVLLGYSAGHGLLLGGSALQLAAQTIGVVAIAAWTIALSALIFVACKHTVGLRVCNEAEATGMDIAKHG